MQLNNNYPFIVVSKQKALETHNYLSEFSALITYPFDSVMIIDVFIDDTFGSNTQHK